jgi:hypothetical protein
MKARTRNWGIIVVALLILGIGAIYISHNIAKSVDQFYFHDHKVEDAKGKK